MYDISSLVERFFVCACLPCVFRYVQEQKNIVHTDAEHLTRQPLYSCIHAHPHSHTYMHVRSATIAFILGLNIVLCEHAIRLRHENKGCMTFLIIIINRGINEDIYSTG